MKQYSDFKNCLVASYTFILYSDARVCVHARARAHTHTHTQLNNKVTQHQFNHYTDRQKHRDMQLGEHGCGYTSLLLRKEIQKVKAWKEKS